MSKRKKSNYRRPQAHKGMGNREYWDAMQELRRSNATVPVRNRSKYNRADYRRKAQAGRYED